MCKWFYVKTKNLKMSELNETLDSFVYFFKRLDERPLSFASLSLVNVCNNRTVLLTITQSSVKVSLVLKQSTERTWKRRKNTTVI